MDPSLIALLTLVAFGTSIIAASVGLGGGIVLVSVMAVTLPSVAVIPIHGAIQLASNTSRAFFSLRHINYQAVGHYMLGALVGALIASQIVVQLDETSFGIIFGISIIALIWVPIPKALPRLPAPFVSVGVASTFMSFFVGASGPLAGPFFQRACRDRLAFVPSLAAAQISTHTLKLLVFGFALGFSFQDYAWLLVSMVVAAFAGSWVGTKLLGKIPERIFVWLFRCVATFLALVLLIRSLT